MQFICQRHPADNLYLLNTDAKPRAQQQAAAAGAAERAHAVTEAVLWHQRLGHMSMPVIKRAQQATEGISTTLDTADLSSCTGGGQDDRHADTHTSRRSATQ